VIVFLRYFALISVKTNKIGVFWGKKWEKSSKNPTVRFYFRRNLLKLIINGVGFLQLDIHCCAMYCVAMFNLDQAILEWRRQVIDAGIKRAVLLEELESHLRQDVEQQMQLGWTAQEAFEVAVARIGRADELKREFAKGDKSSNVNRVLGVLWLAGCLLSFNTVCRQHPTVSGGGTVLAMSMCGLFIYAAGVVGSVFLIRGAKWGRSVVRMLALLMVIACFAQILNFGMAAQWRVWCGVVTGFSLVTIWLLHAPEDKKLSVTAQ
jgi:hypothetical protein